MSMHDPKPITTAIPNGGPNKLVGTKRVLLVLVESIAMYRRSDQPTDPAFLTGFYAAKRLFGADVTEQQLMEYVNAYDESTNAALEAALERAPMGPVRGHQSIRSKG